MMTATTLRQDENPDDYPNSPDGLSVAAAKLDPDFVWRRIETYIARRWTSRDVTWIVEGPGDWRPTLAPATITTVEIWQNDDWQAVTLSPSPLGGYMLPCRGPYRFSGTAGDDDPPPAIVTEAFRRLAEYFAADPGTAGATSEQTSVQNIDSKTIARSAAWMAKAIQNSGAGDLLRNFRHV